MYFLYNGEIREEKLDISIHNRALNYGDGLFETMKYARSRINFWEDHYFRLMAGMRILRMEIPMSFSPEFLEAEIRRLIEHQGWQEQAVRVKMLVFRSGAGLYTPQTREIEYLIQIEQLPQAEYMLSEKGLHADIFQDHYVQKSLLSNLKLIAAPIYVLASIYRQENGWDECFLLNDDKSLCEAISSNIFLVKGKEVLTPAATSGCLKGVMRQQLLQLIPKMGYDLKEVEAISPFELQKVDEVILSNAIKGIQWVEKFRKKTYTNTLSGELIRKLNIAAVLN